MTTTDNPENDAATVRNYLHAALEHAIEAGRSTHEFVDFALHKFGKHIVPHLRALQADIRERRVEVARLAGSAQTAVFGIEVSAAEREQMVRDAAYLIAEKRGGAPGSPEDDWYAAEREIETLLAQQAGLIAKSRAKAASVTSVAEQELAQVRDAVTHWLAQRGKPGKKVA